MKKYLFLSLIFLSACSYDESYAKSCYKLLDDPDGTMLILEEINSIPTLTITDPIGGEPVVATGEFRDGAFIFPDGTKLYFNDEKAWYEGVELVDGIQGKSVACSAI